MTTIHHTITKWAAKNNVAISVSGEGLYTFTQNGTGINATGFKPSEVRAAFENAVKADAKSHANLNAAVKQVKKAVKKAKKAIKKEATPKGEKKTIVTGKSGVMKLPYHTRYMNNGGGSGDDLDVALRAAVLKVQGDSKKPTLDWDALEAVAEANGVWNSKYANLNPGMARMNVSNRLRAKGRNGEVVKIKGKVIDIPPRDSDEE